MSQTKLTARPSFREGADHTPAEPGPTPVLVRWVAGAILFFLIDAAQLLVLLPNRSSEVFAWPIAPALSAYVLASAYIAGGYFFVRVIMGAPWDRVVAGFAPISAFVWLVALATVLHLDRFRTGSVPFLAWAVLYAASPFGIPLLAFVASRRAGGTHAGERLPQGVRGVLAVGGGVVIAAALWLFADPTGFATDWAWTMTPLTTRVVASVLALYGAVWVSVAVDGRRAAATVVLEALAVGLTALLVGVIAGGPEWDRSLAPVLVGGAAVMLVATLAIRLRWGATRAEVAR
jgi:hypothetical protein